MKKLILPLFILHLGAALPAVSMAMGNNLRLPEMANGEAISRAVAIHGNQAYIGIGTRFVTINALQPLSPKSRGELTMDGNIRDIQIDGDYAFIAADEAGLQIVDIANPANPLVAGSDLFSDHAAAVHVAGNYAYVAAGKHGLLVYNVANPAAPELIGVGRTSGWATDVEVVGNYAYVAAGEAGLRLLDINDPLNPTPVGKYVFHTDATSVRVDGQFAYVAAGGLGLRILDVSNVFAPVEVGSIDQRLASRLALQGNRVFVAAEGQGVWVADVSNPYAPVLLTHYPASRSANSVAVAASHAYIAESAGGLLVVEQAVTDQRELRRALLELRKAVKSSLR